MISKIAMLRTCSNTNLNLFLLGGGGGGGFGWAETSYMVLLRVFFVCACMFIDLKTCSLLSRS